MGDHTMTSNLDSSIEDVARANHRWLSYPSSRQYHPDMAKNIIDRCKKGDRIQYMGAYYLAPQEEYATAFSSSARSAALNRTRKAQGKKRKRDCPQIAKLEESLNKVRDSALDIIYLGPTTRGSSVPLPKKFGRYQAEFTSLSHFASLRRPSKGRIGAYFFGELHDAEGAVHWNVAIFDPGGRTMKFFDPVLDAYTYDDSYLEEYWDFQSRALIAKAFDATKKLWLPLFRPQQMAAPGSDFTDPFCQTWVLMFLDAYCNDCVTELLEMPFNVYQSRIVKLWAVQTMRQLSRGNNHWDLVSGGNLKWFPYHLLITKGSATYLPDAEDPHRWSKDDCALANGETYVVAPLPNLWVPLSGTCIRGVLDHFTPASKSDDLRCNEKYSEII